MLNACIPNRILDPIFAALCSFLQLQEIQFTHIIAGTYP